MTFAPPPLPQGLRLAFPSAPGEAGAPPADAPVPAAPDEAAAPQQAEALDPRAVPFYREVMRRLADARVPMMVGGAFAQAGHTGIGRATKDLDLFVRRADFERMPELLADSGFTVEHTFPHWLGKVRAGDWFIDFIHASANGLNPVDDGWFERAADGHILGLPVKVMSAEDMVVSKAFIMERERFDGADVAHLLRACAADLDWARVVARFGPNWRVLLAHLVLFGFIYPDDRALVPAAVLDELLQRLRADQAPPPDAAAPAVSALHGVCQGTLLSREQYLPDLQRGLKDARLQPEGGMSAQEIAAWTAAIDADPSTSAPASERPDPT